MKDQNKKKEKYRSREPWLHHNKSITNYVDFVTPFLCVYVGAFFFGTGFYDSIHRMMFGIFI